MVGLQYGAAAFAAAAASLALLWQSHRRWPFGERRAVGWWLGVATLDASVAALCIGGIFGADVAALHGTSGVLRAVGVGLIGPLGLRSEIRKVRIRGRIESVGPTYIYDLVRVPMLQALDERMTRLHRRDRDRQAEAFDARGWDSNSFANRLDEHLEEIPARDPRDLALIREKLRLAMSPPDETKRMKALLNVAMKERFTSVLEDCAERSPSQDELQLRGDRPAPGGQPGAETG